MKKMQNILSNINWKSKKTIAAVTVAAAVLFAALTGATALTVRHLNTEPAQKTTLPVAEEVTAAAETDGIASTTAANAASTAPASTTTQAQPAGATNSSSSNNSTGSKNTDTGKTGSSTNSGSSSHSTGTNSKPATGSNSSNNSSAKPFGGSTANQTTKPATTTQPAKKEFAMTKQEIVDYATDYIVNTYHCTYYDGFGKDVPGTGYNTPSEFDREDSAEFIKKSLRGKADATYIQNGWYKVYVEQVDEDTMKVYLFY